MLKRAYSFLHVKAVDGEKRIITGTATTPTPDRMGDIVEPLGVQFKNPLPLLLYHNSQKPVGWVKFQKPTKDGIDFEAKLPTIDEPGTVRDRIEEAWTSIKSGLIAGVSIGFRSIEEAFNKDTQGFRFLQTEVLELSLVSIPAQPDARIETIKSLDIGLAVSGTEAVVGRTSAGVPASSSSRVIKMRTEHPMKKSYADQIATWEATRAAKAARMEELQTKAGDEGRGKDDAEREEFKTLASEISGIDEELKDLRVLEANAKAAAKVVAGGDTGEAARARAGEGQSPLIRIVEKQLPPGLRFARMAMAIAYGKGSRHDALDYVKQFWPDDQALIEYTKTAVAAATTANAQGPLLQYTDIQSEFIEYLRPLTILGKFGGPIPNGGGANYPDVTHVPFNVRVGSQTAGGTASWVGEGKAKPLTKGTFSTVTLDFSKLAAISVLTKEEVRFPSIGAQTKVRNDLINAITAQMDKDFIDPANLGTASVKPAAITANIAATTATATTAVGFAVDLKTMITAMLTAGIQPSSLVLIMSQALALSLSLMRTSLGVRNYPDITMNGGFLEGIPVITSEAVTALGSPSTGMIVAVNAKDVFLADDGNVTIATSDQASLEMSDAPAQDGTTGGGASMVSLFQTNMLAILAEREINWKLMRASSVQYIASPAYVPQ